ncbi:MAG: ThiF family adenylyltransferase [bacterium]|nr:ThiF family adenylyltransferase [bacterium]
MAYCVIGCGGIGGQLIPVLCRYLQGTGGGDENSIIFVDGDSYQSRNADRQEFHRQGNKADVSAERMSEMFPSLTIESKSFYVREDNLFLVIREGDTVFSCVDNHKTRKRISDHCKTLGDVVLISGGNEYSDGTVQVYIRQGGEEKTPPITYLHPEIEHPQDRSPDEMSCEELLRGGEVQLLITNFLVAGWMLSAFWLSDSEKGIPYSEQYFDMTTGSTRAVMRNREMVDSRSCVE